MENRKQWSHDKVMNDMLETDHAIFPARSKEALQEYCNDTESVIENVTFPEVFDRVWYRIKNPMEFQDLWIDGIKPDTNDMIKRLSQELDDGLCKCFVGRMTRIVATLDGYYRDIRIEIAESEQIGNVIITMKNARNADGTQKWTKNDILAELNSRNYEPGVVEAWMEAYEEYGNDEKYRE